MTNPVIYETPQRQGSGIPVRRGRGGSTGVLSNRGLPHYQDTGNMEGEQEKEFVDNGFEALRGNVENTLSSEEHDSAAVNEFLSNVHQEELRPDSGEASKDETRNAGDPQRSPTRQEPIANQQSNEESRNRTMDSSAAEMPMTESVHQTDWCFDGDSGNTGTVCSSNTNTSPGDRPRYDLEIIELVGDGTFLINRAYTRIGKRKA